jgi:hypothetical protein
MVQNDIIWHNLQKKTTYSPETAVLKKGKAEYF